MRNGARASLSIGIHGIPAGALASLPCPPLLDDLYSRGGRDILERKQFSKGEGRLFVGLLLCIFYMDLL